MALFKRKSCNHNTLPTLHMCMKNIIAFLSIYFIVKRLPLDIRMYVYILSK